MAKTITSTYQDDTEYGDNPTLQDIIVLDPAPSLNPTVSKGMTLEQLIAFVSLHIVSTAGTIAFATSTTTVSEGSSVDIVIARANYSAYPSSSASCTITISNELLENTDYTLELNGVAFGNGGTANFAQYELSKALTFTSITTTGLVTASLTNFSGFNAGSPLTNTITVI